MKNKFNEPHSCPVCGKYKFSQYGSFEICPVCGWEDDSVQENDPDFDIGPNVISLNEYRSKYEQGWRPEYVS